MLTRAGVAVRRGGGARAALPAALARAGEVCDAVHTSSVITTRMIATLIYIYVAEWTLPAWVTHTLEAVHQVDACPPVHAR